MSISFVGKGWSFPPQFEKGKVGIRLVTGEEDIEKSLKILLSTRQGERFLLPDFGCDLHTMLFEPLDIVLMKSIENMIRDAVTLYEPRITLEDVNFTPKRDDGILLIELVYTIRTTNTRTNMVYPFYLEEGTNL